MSARADRYANTPVYAPEQARVGVAIHVGGGEFVTQCGECLTVFTANYPGNIQDHYYREHGISMPLLPGGGER